MSVYRTIGPLVLQMGGNFILDKHGITRFLYPSKTSMDRPEVELLLQELQVSLSFWINDG